MADRARWAESNSPTPTRTPPARMEATRRVKRPVRRAPSRASRTFEHPALAHVVDVLLHLEHHAQRRVEIRVVEREQRLRPGDRLPHSRQLVELLAAQARYRIAHSLGDAVRHARQADVHYLRLALRRRVVDPVVEAASLERVVQLARAVRRDHDERGALRLDRAQLRNRHLEVGQELVEQRPPQEELLRVEPAGLAGPQVQQLARVVPVVQRVVEVDALVALEADEPRSRRARQRLRHLGLAHTRLALEQQRLLERGGQEDRSREARVGEVTLARQGLSYGRGAVEAQDDAASSSARRVSTRARWRLYSGVAFRSPGGSVPSAACSAARPIESESSACPRSATSAALARSGVEAMCVSPMRTSSHEPSPAFLTSAQTPTIAQSSRRRLNFS